MSPQGTGVPCRSPLPAFCEPHTSVPQVKSSQITATQSPLLLHRCFLGFGSPLEQQAPRHPLSHRYRLASDKAPSSLQCCFLGCPCSISLFHFSLLSPGGHRKRMNVLGKQESPHWAPQDFSLCSANACVLWFVICLSPQPGFPCSPNSFLTDVGMFFLPGAKL